MTEDWDSTHSSDWSDDDNEYLMNQLPVEEVAGTSGQTGHQEYESFACAICFESWTSAGDHRVVSLKCGHLFGHKCVQRSLALRHKCPACNADAEQADVRLLFMDTSAVSSLKQRLQQKENEVVHLTTKLTGLQSEFLTTDWERNILLKRVFRQEAELKEQKDLLAKKETELQQMKGLIAGKDAELQYKDDQVGKYLNFVSDLHQELEYMRTECRRLEQRLDPHFRAMVTVCIRWTDCGTEVVKFQFKLKGKMEILMRKVADKVELPMDRLEFRLKGQRILEKETGDQIGLKHEDVIHVYVRRQTLSD